MPVQIDVVEGYVRNVPGTAKFRVLTSKNLAVKSQQSHVEIELAKPERSLLRCWLLPPNDDDTTISTRSFRQQGRVESRSSNWSTLVRRNRPFSHNSRVDDGTENRRARARFATVVKGTSIVVCLI